MTSHLDLICTRGTMGCTTKHQSFTAETSRYPCQRDESVLLQIQRPTVCQSGEAGNYGQARK